MRIEQAPKPYTPFLGCLQLTQVPREVLHAAIIREFGCLTPIEDWLDSAADRMSHLAQGALSYKDPFERASENREMVLY